MCLLGGLARLEYRGYDSAGVADRRRRPAHRSLGVSASSSTCGTRSTASPGRGSVGIGHTRWATHGRPNEENAHPHIDCDGKIAVVHNGIIENYAELRDELAANGHILRSETDTETIAHLIESYYEGDLVVAVARAIEGA